MRKHLTLLAAAALAAGSYAFLTTDLYGEDRPAARAAGEAARQAKLPDGAAHKDGKDDSDDIRRVLSHAAEASLTNDGFDDLVERFVDADRNRIGMWLKDNKNWGELNGKIDQIRKDWKATYQKDFDIEHEMVFGPAFKNFMIVQGEITDPMKMTQWPVDQPRGRGEPEKIRTGEIHTGEDKVNIGELGKPSNRPEDRNLEKGRDIAVVSYPSAHGMPDVFVSLIQEKPDNWRIDVPDGIDGGRLHANLLKHLTAFGDAKAKGQWPASMEDAQRMLTHHVLMAIYGVEMPAGSAGPGQPADAPHRDMR